MNMRILMIVGLALNFSTAHAGMESIGGWHAIGSDPTCFVEEEISQAFGDAPVSPMSGGATVLPEMTITEPIRAQAAALNHDPVLIFEFVRNRIGYELYYGCLKGAEGTLLSGFGNDVDQCALLGSLLQAADDTIEVKYIRGNVVYSGEFLENLIGCSTNYFSGLNPQFLMNAPVQRADGWEFSQHHWLRAVINGTVYQLDPSFVLHEELPPDAEGLLTGVAGYTRTNLLSVASGGANVFTTEQVQNVNGAAVENLLRGYVAELHQAQKNGDLGVEQLVGQRRVQEQDIPALSTNLPPDMVRVASSSVLNNLSSTMFARYEITHPSGFSAASVNGYALAGRRLTLFYDSSAGNRPVLRLNGEELARGTNNLTVGQKYNLSIKVVLPAVWGNYSKFGTNTLTVGYSYNIVSDFLTASPKILARESRRLATYRAQGLSDASEEVLGTTLHLMGLFYCRQNTLQSKLLSRMTGVPALGLYQSGVVAQEAGYYIDLPLCGVSYIIGMPKASSWFLSSAFFASGLEHGMLEQIMGPEHPGISTTKGISLNNANGKHTYYATSANWTSGLNVRSKLVGYTTAQKTLLDGYINGGQKLLLPRNTVSVGQWNGITFFGIHPENLAAIISGNYGTQNGGYSGYKGYVPPPKVNTVTRTTYIPPPPPPVQLYRPKSIDPVDLYSGSFLFDHVDLAVNGPLPIVLNRHYDSGQTSTAGVLGPGWSHSLQIEIDEHSSGDFAFGERDTADAAAVLIAQMIALDMMRNEDNAKGWTTAAIAAKWALDSAVENTLTIRIGESGRQFTRLPDGAFNPPPGSTDELIRTNNVYVLKERNANTYTFNTNNMIAQIADPSGNTLTFNYNAQTNLQTVISSFGPQLTFSYTGGTQLVSVADNSSPARTVFYQYSSSGNLTNFVDAAGKNWGIAYGDTNHPNAITALTDPQNIVTIQNFYSTLGVVTQQVSATSNLWTIRTSETQSFEQDPEGRQSIYRFDAEGRTVLTRRADGAQTRSFYDRHNRITRTVSEVGITNLFVYDTNHNLIEKREVVGTAEELASYYGYDASNRLVAVSNQISDFEFQVSSFEYDSTHRITKAIDPLGNETTFTYYPNGLLQQKTEGNGTRITSYTYDSYGNPDTITSTDAGTIDLDYNTRGVLVKQKDAKGAETGYFYDGMNRMVRIEYPDGSSVSNSYYANGLLHTTTDQLSNQTTYSWTLAYKEETITFPDGGTVSNTYDAADRLIRTTKNTKHTNYELDSVGRVTSVSSAYSVVENSYDPVGNLTNSVLDPSGLNLWTTVGYDALKRPINQQSAIANQQFFYDTLSRMTNRIDQASKHWGSEYDLLGRKTKALRPSGASEQFVYDASGNRIGFTNAEGKPITFGFDAQGRVTAVTNAIGKVTAFTYDLNGNIISRRDAKNAETLYGYDSLNRLANVTHEGIWKAGFTYDPNGNVTAISNPVSRIVFSHDSMNRLTNSTLTASTSLTVSSSYDLSGNRTNILYPGGLSVSYTYDAENRLESVIANHANFTNEFTFGYDGASRLVSMSYPNGIDTTIGYDAESRVSSYSHSSIINRAIQRDLRGFKTREDIYAGLVPNFTNSLRQTRTHNDADQLLSAGSDTYAYDSNGNLTNAAGVAYEWDYDNRLTSVNGTEYLYDASGARVGRISGGTTNYFILDYRAPLKMPLAETDAAGNITRYYIWSSHGLLCHLDVNPANGSITAIRYYHADEQGSTLALTDETGAVTDQFAYGPYGQALGRTGSTDTPYQWLGGYGVYYDSTADLHLTLYRAYSTDMRRWLSADPMGIDGFENLYAYGNLNPLFFVDPLGLYVLLEAHPVAAGFNHSKIVIIPDDQAAWSDHPDARTFLNGEVYMTIGAGWDKGKLAADLNRKRDVIRTHNVFSTPVNLPAGISENQYIENLLSAHNNYKNNDNVNYSPIPVKSSSSYNSNSYVSGLLNATGGTISTTPPSAPGYTKPLSSSYFQPKIQSHTPANRSSHILK